MEPGVLPANHEPAAGEPQPAKKYPGALFDIDVNGIPAGSDFDRLALLTVFTIIAFTIMSFGGSPSGSDPKSLIIRQLQEEADLNNARQLITVCTFCYLLLHTSLATLSS